jgi:hypothetical protein
VQPSIATCFKRGRSFGPRQTGGRAQRFFKMSCRRAFHDGARRWVLDALGAGVLALGDIKNGFQPTCALSQAGSNRDL